MLFEVGPASAIPPGGRKTVYPFPGPGIGVFNVDGQFYALKNTCPHMGAPLCQGVITGTSETKTTPDGRFEIEWIREGEILKCPWHGWEFDIVTGRTVFRSRMAVATYDVSLRAKTTPHDYHDTESNASGVESYPVVVEDATIYLDLRAR